MPFVGGFGDRLSIRWPDVVMTGSLLAKRGVVSRTPVRAVWPLPERCTTLHTSVVTRDRTAPRWLHLLVVAGTAAVAIGALSLVLRGRPLAVIYGHWVFHNAPVALMGLWLGQAVLHRRPGHRGGWLLLALGVASAVHVTAVALADARLVAAGVPGAETGFDPFRPADLPLDAAIPLWTSAWIWVPAGATAATLFLLIFPDGRLLSRRWRPVVALSGVATALATVAYMIEVFPWATHEVSMGDQVAVDPMAIGLLSVGGSGLAVAVALSVTALVLRWRAADRMRRQQMRPVMICCSAFALAHVVLWPWQSVWIPTSMLTIWALVGAYAFATARLHLHDVDVVVSRAAVAAVLATLFTGAYLALVVGVGGLVGRGGDSTLVPLLAAAVVAVAFDPVRRRVRRVVDRLLYGRERDPHELLSELAAGMRSASSSDELLDEVARLLVDATGAERVEITVRVRDEDRLAAGRGETPRDRPLLGVDVVHEGERLGGVGVFGRSMGDLTPEATELVEDVAATLGVVLRNAQLTAELRAQVEELSRSRERLVAAHDEARRELERDLHDGAQAQLIAVRIRIGLAARMATRRPDPELAALLGDVGDELDGAVQSLRALGRGLHPPALDAGGIGPALRAASRTLPLDVAVVVDGVSRYEPAVESAVYYSCLEAIQNAARHGQARSVRVELSNGQGELRFEVSDDGVGFDPDHCGHGTGLANIEDRIGSLAGSFEVDAAPGRGTRLVGRLPIQLVSDR